MAGRKSQKNRKQDDPASDDAPSFESSIHELQEIVGHLEDGTLPLEESMQQFERGISLLRNCYQVLEQAEQRIEVLTGISEDGSMETSAFDASATFDSSSPGGKSASQGVDEAPADEQEREETPARGRTKPRRGRTTDESLF